MNITQSKFYSDSGTSEDIYKDFIFSYTTDILKSPTNKWVMRNIIDKIKKLRSSTNCSYNELSNDFENGFIYLEPNDEVFNILSNYFSSKGDLNTKKAGLIMLYVKGFLGEHLDSLNISDDLVTLDGDPIIKVLTKEMDDTNIELGNLLEDLYAREPILREANINIKYIYLNSRVNKAFNMLKKALKSKNYSEDKITEEYLRITTEINNIRNNYLDSKNYHTKMNAKYLIEKYNIMKYKTYSNSPGGSAIKFRATLRGLIPNDKFYILDSQYACACGVN